MHQVITEEDAAPCVLLCAVMYQNSRSAVLSEYKHRQKGLYIRK